jgi:LysM repeat protein
MKRLTAVLSALVIVVALLGMAAHVATAQDSGTTYVVQPGDNLYRISLKFGVTMDELARANGIVNPNIVFVGQRLIIPPGAILPTATVVPSAIPSAAPVETTAPPGTEAATTTETPAAELPATATTQPTSEPTVAPVTVPATYTVQPGDNLYRIALKFNTTAFILQQLNGLPNPNIVFVGQVLKLPARTQAQAPAAPTPAPAGTEEATAAPASTAGNVGFAFGLSVALNAQDAAQVTSAVKDLGVGWVKQVVLWRTLEPSKGEIDFATLDAQIDALTETGADVLLTVTSAPDWARNTTTESGPPTDFNDYAAFVRALAERYKGRVKAYEIWNEPNIRREWSGRPLSAASYVEMLRLAYTSIKQADPDAIVVSAGLSPTGYNDGVNAINDRTFLKQAYAAGLASYSDAIGAHPNGWANPPDSTCCNASPGVSGWFNDRSFYFRDTLKDYRDIMTQNGDSGTFIWPTEFGWGSSEGVVEDSSKVDPNFGFVRFTTQAQQAQYVPRAFELGRTLGYVGPMFLSNLNGCQAAGQQGSPEFNACYFALLGTTGSPRPVYDAVKAARK